MTIQTPQRNETRATTRLYLITPPALDPDDFAGELEEALGGGDVACLQLRLKEVDDAAIRRAARLLQQSRLYWLSAKVTAVVMVVAIALSRSSRSFGLERRLG